MITIKTELFKF